MTLQAKHQAEAHAAIDTYANTTRFDEDFAQQHAASGRNENDREVEGGRGRGRDWQAKAAASEKAERLSGHQSDDERLGAMAPSTQVIDHETAQLLLGDGPRKVILRREERAGSTVMRAT
ncbi:hypothetical protein FQR65_LT20525 [Abscondita terminalis]|nr:hypothetical protein FQR65_LT20525 [Abscondita terminalis]